MIYQCNIPYPSITQYTIYGERHSGTNLLQTIIEQYFDLPLTWDYGWKHWFGFTEHERLIKSPRTLFICIIRNPYDWINGFYLNPFHVPARNLSSLEKFIFNEWFSIDPKGNEILQDRNYLTNHRYKNILELRKYKLHYMRYILPNLCDNYVFIRYEDLITDPYDILQSISYTYKIFDRKKLKTKFFDKLPYNVNTTLLFKINKHIDWSLENKVGYFAW